MIVFVGFRIWLLIIANIITAVTPSNSSDNFLNLVITQLKSQGSTSSSRLFNDELSETISRSVEEYQAHDTPETFGNSLYQQNFGYDQNQNENFQHFDAFQNQNYFGDENQLNLAPQTAEQQGPAIIGLQQFNVNGYLNLPPAEGSAEVTEPSTDFAFQNTGPNLFHTNNPIDPSPLAVGSFDPHLLIQNIPNNVPNEGSQELPQNTFPMIPTHYFYNPETSVGGNFMNMINAIKPLENENLLKLPPGKKVVVEPLFVAMAGFVGIAMIFMSAVLFLPKILTPPLEVSSLKGPQELAALTKLAVETIEGKDCTERIACEVGRAMRSMQVGSKPIKVLEVLLPANLAKQLAQIRKAVADKKTCRLIQCKRVKVNEVKAKTTETGQTELLLNTSEVTNGVDEKWKERPEKSSTVKSPKPTTKMPVQKVAEKKSPEESTKIEEKPTKENKRMPAKDAEKTQPQKDSEKKPVKMTKMTTTTEWEFAIFG